MSDGVHGRRLVLRDLGLAALAALLVSAAWAVGALRVLDRPSSDLLLRMAHRPAPAHPGVAAVVIDDQALARHGPLPWPRARLAELVERCWRSGARAVVVDILLAEPGDEAGDDALAAALDRGPVVLAAALLSPGGRWLLPLERFGGPHRAAHVHAELDPDGVVRAIAATKQAGGLSLPALAVAAAGILHPGRAVVAGAQVWPDFVPPPRRIPTVSAGALLDSGAPEPVLAGRVVFLGVTATGATDQLPVPTGGRAPAPGVLVHASAAASLAAGATLAPAGLGAVALWVLVIALVVQALRSRFGRLHIGALAGVAFGALAAAALLLRLSSHLAPPATLLAAVAVAALLREGVESRATLATSDAMLRRLADAIAAPAPTPGDGAGRLALVGRLQEAVLADRELRRVLLDGLDEGVVLWDAEGRPLLANPAAGELWGRVPGRDELTAAIAQSDAIERGGRVLELHVLPVADGSLGVLRDVTERRELERRRAEVQRLVSHELRTPLTSLAGFGSMLERYELSPEELRRVAGLIRSEAERLGATVTSFLELEQLAAGTLEATRGPVDLAALVRGRAEVLAPVAAERRQPLTVDAPAEASVPGVERLLERVVDNLVGNALKHPPQGTPVRVAVVHDGDRVLLTVADDGPGIAADALPHLFERFYRGPGGGPGSGLGLALVSEVVRWHAGEVTVTSRPDEGTVFSVALPAAGGEP